MRWFQQHVQALGTSLGPTPSCCEAGAAPSHSAPAHKLQGSLEDWSASLPIRLLRASSPPGGLPATAPGPGLGPSSAAYGQTLPKCVSGRERDCQPHAHTWGAAGLCWLHQRLLKSGQPGSTVHSWSSADVLWHVQDGRARARPGTWSPARSPICGASLQIFLRDPPLSPLHLRAWPPPSMDTCRAR